MIVAGLTGSIGMGKTTTAQIFKDLGVPVHDSDAAVHTLLGKDGAAVPLIEQYFKKAVINGAVNRYKLGQIVFNDDAALTVLEKILHPLVRNDSNAFLEYARRMGADMAILDIPLLFETDRHLEMDTTIVVSAPANQQAQRVMARGGMTQDRFEKIKNKQYSDIDKRRMADFVIPTGLGKAHARKIVQNIIDEITSISIRTPHKASR